ILLSGCWQQYGNILNIDTTGASMATAKPEGLGYAGVLASETIAARDLRNMEKYRDKIMEVGHSKCVDPAVISAIISRESHAGTVLDNGWGDRGNGFGLMQVDKRYHDITGSWDSIEHISQGADIFKRMLEDIKTKFPTWTKEQQLKAAMSAYNAGPRNIHNYNGMDSHTTHKDYGNDVAARAKFFKQNGY
ncbi:LYG protein, partial [Rhinopomastus cyanomelas]|nr:LYG protein [Rhinopomastus cyanomelas]